MNKRRPYAVPATASPSHKRAAKSKNKRKNTVLDNMRFHTGCVMPTADAEQRVFDYVDQSSISEMDKTLPDGLINEGPDTMASRYSAMSQPD